MDHGRKIAGLVIAVRDAAARTLNNEPFGCVRNALLAAASWSAFLWLLTFPKTL
jgi:hypothetical protein